MSVKRTTTRSQAAEATVVTRNVNKGRGGKRISRERYEAMRKAILSVVPRSAKGIPFTEVMAKVRRRVPKDLFAGASIDWYTATVKLDLEARGLIERVPGSRPQRLRRRR